MAAKKPATKSPPRGARPSKKAAPKRGAPRKARAGGGARAGSVAPKTRAKKGATKKATFGRAGTAGKADGDDAVREWLKAVRPDQRAILKRLDALITESVPGVRKALKWSMPMYGLPGIGWFAHVAAYKNYVTLGFFKGTELSPVPPYGGSQTMRRVNIPSMEAVDEPLFRSWIQQAATRPGWGKIR